MSIIQRAYFDVPSLYPTNLPDWFIHSKHKKVIRVLGATANSWPENDPPEKVQALPLHCKLYSNISTRSQITIESGSSKYNESYGKHTEGFVMMVNNYNSVKEYDITGLNINFVEFDMSNVIGDEPDAVGAMIEMELILIEE
jgi:hypothetical protein